MKDITNGQPDDKDSGDDIAVRPTLGHELLAGLKQGVWIGLAALVLVIPTIYLIKSAGQRPVPRPSVAALSLPPASQPIRLADLGAESASPEAKFIANWVADSRDNGKLSFVIIDKKNAKVFVFDAEGKLIGATPVLLGAMPGDDSVTGIGKRPISEVRPEERTTPAGRFVGEPGRNANGEDVVWVDYDAAVSMHRVRIVDPKERRLERLATPTTADNRISFGCVNIPVPFFENVLSPEFRARFGIVYVLPEEKAVRDVFTRAYDPADRLRMAARTPSLPSLL